MKVEIVNNVTTIKINNKIYFKIQDIAEKYTAGVRIHKVKSNLNVLTGDQIIAFKKTPCYKYNSADYISKEELKTLVKQRIQRLESSVQVKKRGRKLMRFDIQTAIWVRDILAIDINIQHIVGLSNRSQFSVNRNAKKSIRRNSKAMPK